MCVEYFDVLYYNLFLCVAAFQRLCQGSSVCLLQCVLHCDVVSCGFFVARRVSVATPVRPRATVCCSVLPCVAVCCRVLQCAAVCCSVLQCAAVCCSVRSSNAEPDFLYLYKKLAHTLQHSATHCSTLQLYMYICNLSCIYTHKASAPSQHNL